MTDGTRPEAASRDDAAFFGHPRGLATLFFTEFWERFSYYGMRAFLILFMTAPRESGGLAFETAKAGAIYGIYVALVYLMSVPGGWLADRHWGQRRATLYGGVVIMSGHVCLALPGAAAFYLGLALVTVGTGLLKPNVSAMVGELYAADDRRRDAGFSLYYMGINLGASVAPVVTGWLAQSEEFRGWLGASGLDPTSAWHWGFGAAAVGMLFGLIQYVSGWKHLGAAGVRVREAPAGRARGRRRLPVALGVAAVLAILAAWAAGGGLTAERLSDATGVLLVAIVAGVFGQLLFSGQWSAAERRRLVVIFVLFCASSVFWALYEQAGSTLNLFAERSTATALAGYSFPASWFQSVLAAFVIVLAPLFAWLWIRLGAREPSSPGKFVLGLLSVAAGFAVLIAPARLAAGGARVSPLWLVGTYFLFVVGELCLSPVGLSATTRLAPARASGLMMGVWFLSISVGGFLGGRVASLYETFSLPALFATVAGVALAAGLLLALAVRPISRMLARG